MSWGQIEATSPTRVDLAGGTVDLWPLYLFHKQCCTVNLAIDIKTRVVLKPRRDSKVILSSQDVNRTLEFAHINEVPEGAGHDLHLLRVHAEFWRPETGFELYTSSESPVGAGIAASSSLNITLCGAFSRWTGKHLSHEDTVRLAGNLEARVIQAPTGCQDYFPALFGGLNLIELTPMGPERFGHEIDIDAFHKRFILVYTGRPHHSGMNNWQIFKDHIDNKNEVRRQFERIAAIARRMKDVILEGAWERVGPLFDEEYQARMDLSPVFGSPEIERLRDWALRAGAEAVKICGAGGGGCVFLWTPPNKRTEVESRCSAAGFQVLNAKPTKAGLEIRTS